MPTATRRSRWRMCSFVHWYRGVAVYNAVFAHPSLRRPLFRESRAKLLFELWPFFRAGMALSGHVEVQKVVFFVTGEEHRILSQGWVKTRGGFGGHFSWQAQYLVNLDDDLKGSKVFFFLWNYRHLQFWTCMMMILCGRCGASGSFFMGRSLHKKVAGKILWLILDIFNVRFFVAHDLLRRSSQRELAESNLVSLLPETNLNEHHTFTTRINLVLLAWNPWWFGVLSTFPFRIQTAQCLGSPAGII